MSKESKGWLIALIVNFALIAVGIFFLELTFGNWAGHDDISRLNLIRDRKMVYEVGDLYVSSSDQIVYTRDEYGLRGDFSRPEEIDILVVGGSTTDQRYVTDGDTWEAITQQELRHTHSGVVIANAGVDGQSTFGHIKNFDWWFPTIPGLRPEYVLYYVGINDFYKDEGNGYDALVKGGRKQSLWRTFKEKSALYNMQRVLQGIYQAEVKQKIGHKALDLSMIDYVSTPLQTDYDEVMRTRLQEYRERLEILIEKTKEMGAIPVFVTQPARKYRFDDGKLEGVATESRYDETPINGVDYYYMLRKLDAVTASVAEAHGALLVDVGSVRDWDDEDFYDLIHMTPSGASKVGKYIASQLENSVSFASD